MLEEAPTMSFWQMQDAYRPYANHIYLVRGGGDFSKYFGGEGVSMMHIIIHNRWPSWWKLFLVTYMACKPGWCGMNEADVPSSLVTDRRTVDLQPLSLCPTIVLDYSRHINCRSTTMHFQKDISSLLFQMLISHRYLIYVICTDVVLVLFIYSWNWKLVWFNLLVTRELQ